MKTYSEATALIMETKDNPASKVEALADRHAALIEEVVSHVNTHALGIALVAERGWTPISIVTAIALGVALGVEMERGEWPSV